MSNETRQRANVSFALVCHDRRTGLNLGASRTDDADGSPLFSILEVCTVKSSMSRIAALAISLPLLGCVAAQQEAISQGDCDATTIKRRALVAHRAALFAEMKRDVALGQDGGVPGRSFDDRSTANADAYVRRVKQTWTATDKTLHDAMRDLDRRSDAAGCPAF